MSLQKDNAFDRLCCRTVRGARICDIASSAPTTSSGAASTAPSTQTQATPSAQTHSLRARAVPAQAYFVKCDSETTTQADIDNGIVNILVGFAPLQPAEFVVIQIEQLTGQATS